MYPLRLDATVGWVVYSWQVYAFGEISIATARKGS